MARVLKILIMGFVKIRGIKNVRVVGVAEARRCHRISILCFWYRRGYRRIYSKSRGME